MVCLFLVCVLETLRRGRLRGFKRKGKDKGEEWFCVFGNIGVARSGTREA